MSLKLLGGVIPHMYLCYVVMSQSLTQFSHVSRLMSQGAPLMSQLSCLISQGTSLFSPYLNFHVSGSITVLLIKPSGRVALLELGGAGHFPPEMLTFN